jgi:hypothetical protein
MKNFLKASFNHD